jgi:FMN phosphatase YigB (HAD superfamily)
MQLFFDIDGVLLNFERAFVAWMNAQYGMGLPEDYEASNWDFTDVLDAAELDRRWRRFLGAPEAARMEPLIAPERFNALVQDHQVHLVTNFPLPHMERRLENLTALGFVYESLHHCGFLVFDDVVPKTKAQTIAALRRSHQPALFVDDHPDNCMDVLRNCRDVEVWLMSRRFNRQFEHPEVKRAQDWECVVRRLGRHDLAKSQSMAAAG